MNKLVLVLAVALMSCSGPPDDIPVPAVNDEAGHRAVVDKLWEWDTEQRRRGAQQFRDDGKAYAYNVWYQAERGRQGSTCDYTPGQPYPATVGQALQDEAAQRRARAEFQPKSNISITDRYRLMIAEAKRFRCPPPELTAVTGDEDLRREIYGPSAEDRARTAAEASAQAEQVAARERERVEASEFERREQEDYDEQVTRAAAANADMERRMTDSINSSQKR